MVRVLEHGSNFDLVQFEDRVSELMALERIYTAHPDWRKGGRRLSGPLFDHLNPISIIGKALNYAPVNLAPVNLATCWFQPTRQCDSRGPPRRARLETAFAECEARRRRALRATPSARWVRSPRTSHHWSPRWTLR